MPVNVKEFPAKTADESHFASARPDATNMGNAN
jgi:hypothetical protein